MPQIDVHLIKDVLNAEQKKQVIEKLTDAIVSIAGENLRGATWAKIFEINSGERGIGGKPLTTEAVKELAAGRQRAWPWCLRGAALLVSRSGQLAIRARA